MPQPESRVVNAIREAIKREYPKAWVLKVHGGPYQTAGVPDLLVCVDGRLFGLEVKAQRPGESAEHARGRASVTQQLMIDRMQRAGAPAGVVLSPAEALGLLAQHLDK